MTENQCSTDKGFAQSHDIRICCIYHLHRVSKKPSLMFSAITRKGIVGFS